MKFFHKRGVAAIVMVLAIVTGAALGQLREPDGSSAPSTAIVGTYTYTYDHAGVLTDKTMEHMDAMNASLFAQTGAQILTVTVDTTDGQDIMDYALDLGNTYGVGSAERNNGVVMVLALENISQSGLVGDYCVVVGDGLGSHVDDFTAMQSYYLESDFAAGDYDAGVLAAFDAFIAWFADFYGVDIREGYIPAVPETYSSGTYYTESTGYFAPTFGTVLGRDAGAARGVGDPGRRPLQPLPAAVSAAGHGAAHGAVLSHLLGTAPAAPSSQTAQIPPASQTARISAPRRPRRLWRRRLLRRGLRLRRTLRRQPRGQFLRQPQRRILRRQPGWVLWRQPGWVLWRRQLRRRLRREPGRLRRRILPGRFRRQPRRRRLPGRRPEINTQ